MTSIAVNLTRQGRHWRIQVAVDGKIEPTDVFGCTDGMLPLLTGLERAESEANAIFSRPERQMRGAPPSITVAMPSGRHLTFELTSVQQALAEGPELVP
jgi:S-formylglutathione hydrolase FrmB